MDIISTVIGIVAYLFILYHFDKGFFRSAKNKAILIITLIVFILFGVLSNHPNFYKADIISFVLGLILAVLIFVTFKNFPKNQAGHGVGTDMIIKDRVIVGLLIIFMLAYLWQMLM